MTKKKREEPYSEKLADVNLRLKLLEGDITEEQQKEFKRKNRERTVIYLVSIAAILGFFFLIWYLWGDFLSGLWESIWSL